MAGVLNLMADRSEETKAQYRQRVEQLRRQTALHWGQADPAKVAPLDLVEHLISRKDATPDKGSGAGRTRRHQGKNLAISRATWRQYKAALLFVLQEELTASSDDLANEERQVAIDRLASEPQTGALKHTVRTSGRKQKSFDDADFKALIDYLEAHVGRHRRATQLLTWLKAGRLVGVRPSEWQSAGLVDIGGIPAVRFENAKTSNGRGNGTTRTLLLADASPEDIEAIDDMIYTLDQLEQEPGYDFAQDVALLGRYMRYVTRRVLGRRNRYPTLYSLRHQVAADAKRLLTQKEVAALLGHGSDLTAVRDYGKRRKGQRPLKVRPDPAAVDTVRHSPKVASPHQTRRD